jgi:hypothetical protein
MDRIMSRPDKAEYIEKTVSKIEKNVDKASTTSGSYFLTYGLLVLIAGVLIMTWYSFVRAEGKANLPHRI